MSRGLSFSILIAGGGGGQSQACAACASALLTAALALTLASPMPALASSPCDGRSRARTYEPTVLPDEDGWTRYDHIEPGYVAPEVFIEDGVLVIDASTGHVATTFSRRESVTGLSPAYRLEMEVSQTWTGYYGGWLKKGGYAGAIFQDRLALVYAIPMNASEVHLGIPVDPGNGSPYLDLVHVGTVGRGDLAVLTLTGIRDSHVRLEIDGVAAGDVAWSALPLIDHEAVQALGAVLSLDPGQAGVFFGAIGSRSEWSRVAYEICETDNVGLWIETHLPSEPDGRTLRGGMGETLEGLERIHAVLDRVDIVHRGLEEEDEEELLTVLEGPVEVEIFDAESEDALTRMTGLRIPPGELKQLRLVVSEMALDIRGESHPVRVPSGADSGIKMVFPGGIDVQEGETLALVVSLDPFGALGRNRAGFWWDPVIMEGRRWGPGQDPRDSEPWEPPWWWPPGEEPPHGPGRWNPDVCVGPDCPRGPIGPACEDDEVLVWEPPRGFRCEDRCPDGFRWLDPPRICFGVAPQPSLDDPPGPGQPGLYPMFPRPCDGHPQEVPLVIDSREWLADFWGDDRVYQHNLDYTWRIHTNTFVSGMDIEFDRISLDSGGDVLHVQSHGGGNVLPGQFYRETPNTVLLGIGDDPYVYRGQEGDLFIRLQTDFNDPDSGFTDPRGRGSGFRTTRAFVYCRDEPTEQQVPHLRWPQPAVGLLLGDGDVVYFRIAGLRHPQSILLQGMNSGLDIDLYARRGGLPSQVHWDLAVTGPGAEAYLELPAGRGVEWFIAVHSRGAAGSFMLKRAIHFVEKEPFKVGVALPSPTAAQMIDIEEATIRQLRQYFGAYEGVGKIESIEIWPTGRCGGLTRARCDLVVLPAITGLHGVCRKRPWGRWIEVPAWDLSNEPYVLAHELGHCFHDLADEYHELIGPSLTNRCGHSVMGLFPWGTRSTCTFFNHETVSWPDAVLQGDDDMWSQVLGGAGASLVWTDVEARTNDAFDFSHHEFGGRIRINRRHYVVQPDGTVTSN